MQEKGIINIHELIKGIAIICSYPLLAALIAIPFSFLTKLSNQLFYIVVYLVLTIIFIKIYYKDFQRDIKSFKVNYKSILKKALLYWFIGLIIMIISSNIIALTNIPTNVNQQANIDQFKSMPFMEIICACLLAPIIEEHVYRKSLAKFTQNKHLYAIVSGLFFAFAHITSSLTTPNSFIMLIYIIPFGALGIAFGYLYKETDNICGNILIHMLHNIISIIEIIIIIVLGG